MTLSLFAGPPGSGMHSSSLPVLRTVGVKRRLMHLSFATSGLWGLLTVSLFALDALTPVHLFLLQLPALYVLVLLVRLVSHVAAERVLIERVMHAPGQVSRDSSGVASPAQSVGHAP